MKCGNLLLDLNKFVNCSTIVEGTVSWKRPMLLKRHLLLDTANSRILLLESGESNSLSGSQNKIMFECGFLSRWPTRRVWVTWIIH